jgi:hypothetical protein
MAGQAAMRMGWAGVGQLEDFACLLYRHERLELLSLKSVSLVLSESFGSLDLGMS